MLRRHQQINIPIDILRTVQVIINLGSFTKAGERLGLTQPAITAQIKRLQLLVGGQIFDRTAGGVTLNDRGRLMMPVVRRLLEANDQILELGGAAHDPRPIRLGMSDLYAENFIKRSKLNLHECNVICDHSNDLIRGLADGYVDICALLRPQSDYGTVIDLWVEPFVWVRSSAFTLRPGSPVPLVGWPGLLSNQIAINVLESSGIAYRLACSSYDRNCRIAAVEASIGVLCLPKWAIPPTLQEAKEYYLPPLPRVEAGIMTRNGVDPREVGPLVEALRMFRQADP